MSLSSLANDELLRTDRTRLRLSEIVEPQVLNLNLDPNSVNMDRVRSAIKEAAAANPVADSKTSSALDGIVKYVPTESVTLYVAATSALDSLKAFLPSLTPCGLYLSFIALTPIFFVLIYIGKRRGQGLRWWPAEVKNWPWWKVISSTVAFAFWAPAVPPLVGADGKAAAALGAVLVSALLGLFGKIFEPGEVASG